MTGEDRIDWIGPWTLYGRQVLRFVKVSTRTIAAPVPTALLFLAVIAPALGIHAGKLVFSQVMDYLPMHAFRRRRFALPMKAVYKAVPLSRPVSGLLPMLRE